MMEKEEEVCINVLHMWIQCVGSPELLVGLHQEAQVVVLTEVRGQKHL